MRQKYQFPRLKFINRKSVAATLLSAGLMLSGSTSWAQDHFIGEDQSVSRVIKLRSSAAPKMILKPVEIDKTSRSVKSNMPVSKPANSKAPSVLFEEIEAGSVPTVLQSTRNAPTRIAEKPRMMAGVPAVNSSGAPQVDSEPIQQNFNRNWNALNRTIPANATSGNKTTSPVSVAHSAPMINTTIEAPGYINLNQPATIRLRIQNVGQSTARQVKLLATLPAHAKFSRATPAPTKTEGQVMEFRLSNVGAQQVREVSIELIPTEKLALDIATEVMVENTQRIAVGVREPKLNIKITGPSDANIGQNLTHQIVIKNTGDGIAQDIRLKTEYPEALQHGKMPAEISIPNLEPGHSFVVDLNSQARAPGKTALSVQTLATGIKAQSATSELNIHQPELEVSAVGPEMNFVNREGVYTIKLKNTGEVDVSNVSILLQVPHGLEVTTINREASVDSESGLLTWSFDKIVAASEQVIQLKTLAVSEGQQVCTIAVRSDETREKEIQLTTEVATRSNLTVNINNQSGPIRVGGQAQFMVTVENKGSRAASDINVLVELPDSLTPVQQDGIEVQEFGNTITFRDGQIEPGQKREFAFLAVGAKKGEHVVRSVLKTANSERQIAVEGSVYVYEVSEARVSELLSPVIPR